MIKNCNYIGITGLARSGKNLFADIMGSVIQERLNLSCKSFALAYALKTDCEDFISQKLHLNVWTEKSEEKEIFRPLLVWYGFVKRKQTEGRYWTDLLMPYMQSSDADVKFVTDIRYTTYDRDEVFWLRNELNGKLIHISKYSIVNGQKIYLKPPNEDEATHDPILKRMADIRFEWEDMPNASYSEKLVNAKLRDRIYNECVRPILGE